MSTNKNPERVLILGGRSPVALDLARSFARLGTTVYLADSFPNFFAKASKSVKKSFHLPSPRFQSESFIEKLSELITQYKIQMVIPTCEEVFHLAKYKHLLPKSCEIFTDDYFKLLSVHDKFDFISLLKTNGFGTPETRLVESQACLQKLLVDKKKWLLKPRYSRFADDVIFPEQLKERARNLDFKRNWVAQEFLTGRHLSSYSVAIHGKVAAHTVYPCHYRYGGGPSVYFKHEVHSGIERFVHTFVSNTNFHGQIAFDFIETTEGLYAIECNPRATSGIHILQNEPNFARSFNGEILILSTKTQASMLSFGMAAIFHSQLRRSDFLNYIRALWNGKDAVFSSQDMRPFFYVPRALLGFWAISRRHKISLSQAMTHDIAFNEESKA